MIQLRSILTSLGKISSFNLFRSMKDVKRFVSYYFLLILALLVLERFGLINRGGAVAALIGGFGGGLITLFLVLPVTTAFTGRQKREVFRRISELNYVSADREENEICYLPRAPKLQQWEGNRIIASENDDGSFKLTYPLGIAHRFNLDVDF